MKEELIKILDYLRDRLVNDKCTVEEMESIFDTICSQVEIKGTIADFAQFFGKPESNVRTVISRRNIPSDKKPERKVFYDFLWFLKSVPASWKKK